MRIAIVSDTKRNAEHQLTQFMRYLVAVHGPNIATAHQRQGGLHKVTLATGATITTYRLAEGLRGVSADVVLTDLTHHDDYLKPVIATGGRLVHTDPYLEVIDLMDTID